MSNSDDVVTGGGAGPTRRPPRQGVGGSPVGSTVSIVLAALALIAGFLILRDLTGDDSVADDGSSANATLPTAEPTTTFDSGVVATVVSTTSTTVPFVTTGATVVVANANTVGGSAGRMTETLADVGFQMGSPVNASVTVEDSLVYFDPSIAAAEAVAQSVGRALGGVAVAAVPTPPPTESGTLGDAGVLVLLGNEQADKTLEQLAEAAGTTPVTGTSPPIAGDVVAPADPAATPTTVG